jgi:iron complex outermembrane receptor protein
VNGVINIITRSARDTTGTLVSAGGGNQERNLAFRHGRKLGEDASYRITASSSEDGNTERANGTAVRDSWHRKALGMRMDWGRGGDALTLDANVYDGALDQVLNADNKKISGAHLLGRWNRRLGEDSSLQVQTYLDRTKRDHPGTFGETLDTFDLDVQHRFAWGPRHDILWGGGYRFSRDDVVNTPLLAFFPARRNLTLANAFVQDSIALDDKLQLTLGAKLEHNNYTGLEFQPNARLAWKMQSNALLWSAVSRSVRTPSRLDRDFFVPSSAPFIFAGGPDFVSEKLVTYEVGYRAQPTSAAAFSISAFYNVYDDLRSIERVGPGLQSVFANQMEGSTYGIETWGSYRVNDWWRLNAGYNYLVKDLRFKPGSRDAFGVQAAGNDPRYQLSLRSSMNLSHNTELDLMVRKIGSQPNPNAPGYVELDMRLGWVPAKGVEISLSGFNLLHSRHPESGAALTRSEIVRSVYLKTLWTF